MARTIGLVAAPKRQRGSISRATEQYDVSPVFRRARDYCDRTFGEWYILSTRYHLLSPQQVIGPGEPVLHALPLEERTQWAECVAASLRERCARSAEPLTFMLYASQRTADLLVRAAPEIAIELPLSGLGLYERLRWYDERLRVESRMLVAATPYVTTDDDARIKDVPPRIESAPRTPRALLTGLLRMRRGA